MMPDLKAASVSTIPTITAARKIDMKLELTYMLFKVIVSGPYDLDLKIKSNMHKHDTRLHTISINSDMQTL